MWKSIFGTVGLVGGALLAAVLLQFPGIWLIALAGLLVGAIGVLVGMALDARAFTPQVIFGTLGYLLGAPLGGLLVWFVASFHDTFSGGGLAGIFIGVPVGALLGCALGLCVGGLLSAASSKR